MSLFFNVLNQQTVNCQLKKLKNCHPKTVSSEPHRMTSLEIAELTGKKQDFDELILEKRGTTIWVHFAVRPRGNRRYVDF